MCAFPCHALFPHEDVHTHIYIMCACVYVVSLGFWMYIVEVQVTVQTCSLRQFFYRIFYLWI
jgi:hypothetical protein